MTYFDTSKMVWDVSSVRTLKELERVEEDVQKHYNDTKQEEERLKKDIDDFDKKSEPIVDLCFDVDKVTGLAAFMAVLFNTFFAPHRVFMSFISFALIGAVVAILGLFLSFISLRKLDKHLVKLDECGFYNSLLYMINNRKIDIRKIDLVKKMIEDFSAETIKSEKKNLIEFLEK